MVYVASLDGHVYAFGPSRAFYAPKGSSYAGCFPDDGSDSTTGLFATRVPAPSGTAAGHSVDTCVAAAATKGLAWAGLRAGGECYVGGAWGNKTLLAARGDRCAAPCAGNATQICGGAGSVSVYAVASVGASPSPSSTGGAGLSTTAVAGIAVGAVAVVCVVVGVLAVVVLRRRRGGGVDRRGSGVDSDGAKKEGASGPSFMLTE
ncbi:hypothetical protein DFJ73DRAFT_100266 [Zopfochytrium polystomum]|nr:hypothetical protein DFJ73DRAFT_100266 [Zopfochytrium polystomum]